MGKTVAVIMAGGRGKRMDVLCHVRPKPALPFAGEFSVIDFALSNCVYSGITDLTILTDYQRSYMARYLEAWGLSNAVRTLVVLEPTRGSYEGTADAVFQNLPHLDEFNARNVLILAGDHVYKMDYREMITFHEQTGADVTVGIVSVPIEEAHRFGTVTVGYDGEILEFAEKSKNSQSNLASMGIYIFNEDTLAERLTENAQTDLPHDFGYAILPGMIGRDRVKAYEFTGYWRDIGTPEAYYVASMELLSARPPFSLHGTRPVLTRRLDLPPSHISDRAKVVNSLISPGCVIEGYVENSILSPGVWVDERAEVWNSVLMQKSFVGYHSVVDTCIMDERVNIDELCYIGFGASLLPGYGEITLVGRGVSVPAQTVVNRNSRVLPNAEISSLKSNPVALDPTLMEHSTVQKRWVNEEVQTNERESIHVA